MAMNTKLRTRFAPSPTGKMHLGSLRCAAMSYLWSVQNDADFILRIDDTDQDRSRQDFIDDIENNLESFDIKWNYSFKQSSRKHIYTAFLEQCINAKIVYSACETEAELSQFKTSMQKLKLPPAFKKKYAKTIDSHAKQYWRFELPNKVIKFYDLIKGYIEIDLRHFSDPIICKNNGNFTYTFASVIDDCVEEISHIIRGVDHISNTAIQIGIIESLIEHRIIEKHDIRFGHYSLLVSKSNTKLSKRNNSLTIQSLKNEFHELSILHYVTFLSNTRDKPVCCSDIRSLSKYFDLSRYATSNTIQFDLNAIYAWQKYLFNKLDYKYIKNWFEKDTDFSYPFLKESVVSNQDLAVWHKIMREKIVYNCPYSLNLSELASLISGKAKNQQYKLIVDHLHNSLKSKKSAMYALRRILTGQHYGPNLQQIFDNLSEELLYYRILNAKISKLQIYQASSQNVVEFIPINTDHVRMYACGPTLYAAPHLGNIRSFIVFDIICRALKYLYPKVTYVRNITDIDDKIIKASKDQNISEQELVDKYRKIFAQNNNNINLIPPNVEPSVTNSIKGIISFITKIQDAGFAYMSDEGLYFNIKKYIGSGNKYPIFSTCCHHNNYTHEDDFILWRAKSDNEIGWNSPWGYGRPGWHIECTVMAYMHLGLPFDLHCGGIDLQFPHHTNENAQAIAAGYDLYSGYWVHSNFLHFKSDKMSKSQGNTLRLSDINLNPMIIKIALLMTHYRSIIHWSDNILQQARSLYNKWRRILGKKLDQFHVMLNKNQFKVYDTVYLNTLLNDLNISSALTLLDQHIISLDKEKFTTHKDMQYKLNMILACFELIGIEFDFSYLNDEKIQNQIDMLNNAKHSKDFKTADEIRACLKSQNIVTEELVGQIYWYEQY